MTIKKNTQKLEAYSFLKEKILNCEILPGQYINEKELLKLTQLGRTPVREALIMLQTENLVEARPRKGTYAKMITKTNLMEMYTLRKILETSIITQYYSNIDLQKLLLIDSEMKNLCFSEAYTPKKFYKLDMEFHRFLASSSQNQQILAILEPLFQETYRIGMLNKICSTENEPSQTYEQHHEIINAVLQENKQRIKDAILYHLNISQLSSLRTINNYKNPQE